MATSSIILEPLSYGKIEGWNNDDHVQAFAAFLNSANCMAKKPYSTRHIGADGEILAKIAAIAITAGEVDRMRARTFFETHFQPNRIIAPQAGFLTGFFEPRLRAARERSGKYRFPVYRRPADLVDMRDHNRPSHIDNSFRFGKKAPEGIEHYHDRAAIDGGILDRQGLEIAWLDNRVDQFFVHIQGAAQLRFSDGTSLRITFAAKSGHPYTSLGEVLCKRLGVPPEEMTADRLAYWMRENPGRLDELLWQNRSYIFFREVNGQSEDEGPVAAAGCPLVAGRSLAVDRMLHTFGTPIWIATRNEYVDSTNPLRRLTVAHDTGSAIVGPCRGDIFIGSGQEAGLLAGRVRHEMDMITLLPRRKS